MSYDNPIGTLGLAFVEFSADKPDDLSSIFAPMDFQTVAVRRDGAAWTRSGGVNFLISGSSSASFARTFATRHGPSASSMGFLVKDAGVAMDQALLRGATPYDGSDGVLSVSAPAIVGIGGSLIYFVEQDGDRDWRCEFTKAVPPSMPSATGAQFTGIDHITHNVVKGGLNKWREFYEKIFNFRPVFELDVQGLATGFKTYALRSPCDGICIPINEPSDSKSQIQEFIDIYNGEGIQHIAFSCEDIYTAVERLRTLDFAFQDTPNTYYDMIDDRLPGHGEDTERLKQLKILIDGSGRDETGAEAEILLQIFSKNAIGPIFFEFIQRKGNEGFGEGNAAALFESIEKEQIERGYIQVSE